MLELFRLPSVNADVTASRIVGTLFEHDRATGEHSIRVAQLVAAVGGVDLFVPALVHDSGKYFVAQRILAAPRALTCIERRVVEMHPDLGVDWLQEEYGDDGEIPELWRVMTRFHHENWDGSGYPLGRRRGQIPAPARLLRVADAYDAMTSPRAYRPALPHDEVSTYLRSNAGILFDPALVERVIAAADARANGAPSMTAVALTITPVVGGGRRESA